MQEKVKVESPALTPESSRVSSKARHYLPLAQKTYKPVLGYLIALIIIFIGLWTVPARVIPANKFDEPIWMFHSICPDAIFGPDYQEACRNLTLQGLDHSAGAKFVLAIGRWFLGIPAEAVKYYYHTGVNVPVVDPQIRESMVGFLTFVSSITLLLIFFALQCSFGSLSGCLALALMVFTTYWQFSLRAIMAEPSIMLGSAFALISTLWLGTILLGKKSLSLPLAHLAAVCAGLSVGFSAGVKINAGLVGIGLAVVIGFAAFKRWRDWLLLLWLSTTALISASLVFILTNPVLWGSDFLERLRLFFVFRPSLLFGMLSGNSLSPYQSVLTSFESSYSSPYFNVFPALISVPLSVVGLVVGLKSPNPKIQVVTLWLLATGLVNAFIVPQTVQQLTWDRYQIFTTFAIQIFTAIGLAQTVVVVLNWRRFFTQKNQEQSANLFSGNGNSPTKQAYQFTKRSYALTGVSLVVVLIIVGGAGLAYQKGSKERKLWQQYVLAASSPTDQIEVLNKLVELNPKERLSYKQGSYVPDEIGKPVVQELLDYFRDNRLSTNTATLEQVSRTGGLLRLDSQDVITRNLVNHELQGLNEKYQMRIATRVDSNSFSNNSTGLWVADEFKANPKQFMGNAAYHLEATIQAPQDGSYHLIAIGANLPAPPIKVGVKIDGIDTGVLFYNKGDKSWTGQYVTTYLKAGNHKVEFEFLNDATVNGVDRNAAIREIYLEPADEIRLCSTEQQSGNTLNLTVCSSDQLTPQLSSDNSEAVISVTAPLTALYDVQLNTSQINTISQTLSIKLDGKPFANIPLREVDAAGKTVPLQPNIMFPTLFLSAGKHEFTVKLTGNGSGNALRLNSIIITPRYPTPTLFTANQFGSKEAVAILQKNSELDFLADWYGVNYDFYKMQVQGAVEGAENLPVDVLVNDQTIGQVVLDKEGNLPQPLFVELPNGGQFKVALRIAGSSDNNSKAYIYSVNFERDSNQNRFAATTMSWDKEFNKAVSSSDTAISINGGVKLSRYLQVPQSDYYDVIVRTRNHNNANAQTQLQLDVDGWSNYHETLPTTSEWTELKFRVYLDQGIHQLQFYQTGNASIEKLDIMYVTIQGKAAIKPVSKP